jgi:puromycin-sensitive aminopeptidase
MGDRNFRLPTTPRPERYRFAVRPDLAAKTFAASGTITVTFTAPARSFRLHGVHLEVAAATLVSGGESRPLRVTGDDDSQTLEFTAESDVPAGPASLEVRYSGRFHDDLRGLYLAGGIGVTQFEAADARRVFPCFDEPAFKATWELAIDAPAELATLSNGAITGEEAAAGRKVVTFAATPRMSSYLVAMIVGRLVSSEEREARGVAIRTWAVPEKAHLAAFAQECAAAVLPLLEDYFGRPYAFGKLDQIGVPDFEAGAMENSGCVTFREVALLLDPERAPLPVQKRVAEVITHELAHQWFGNLVTMEWWDDLWLNEAFATWMAYKIVDQWKPAWRMWDDFEGGKATALHLDSLESTHPIRYEVLNADQATENFDAITYEKGGAMLRMLEGYLGADAFRAGIRDYMQRHAFANASADDLWNALGRASNQPIAEVANGWIGRGAYPVLELAPAGGGVTLSQRQFSADPALFAAKGGDPWLVPVVLRWADDAGEHETRHLLRERSATLELGARGTVRFVCANRGGAGFYRVKYERPALEALARNASSLEPVERMNLVADAWALFRAGAAPLADLLDLMAALAPDPDYVVLGEVVGKLDLLERRCLAPADRQPFAAWVGSLLAPQLAAVGWDSAPGESDAVRLRRAAVIRGLALVARQPAAVAEASRRLAQSWSGQGAIDPNLLDAVHVAAARGGDERLFEALKGRVTSDPDPAAKRRYLVSLASVEAPELLPRAVQLLLQDTVPMQDVTIYLAALLGNREAQADAWRLVRERWPELHRKSAAPMLTRRVVESLGELVHVRAEVEAFFDAHAESLRAAPAAVRQTRERMRLDEDVQRRARAALSAWLAGRN